MNNLPPIREMERAYLARDTAYDGIFFLGVRTTGIFCRPVCPVRSPLPKNVEYYPSPREALVAGYRPCKRCRPMAMTNQPEWATQLLARVEAEPSQRITEKQLAEFGVDPATVRRHFLKQYGMTFQAYSRARRLSVAFNQIREGSTVDDEAFASGYESLSGFREAFGQSIGCPPGESDSHDCVFLAWIDSPLGPLVAGANSKGICLLEFTDRRMIETQFEEVKSRFRVPVLPGSNPHLAQLQEELEAYFARELKAFRVPLVYPGTPFQEKVWDQLLLIPYGETRSYQEIATAVGDAKAVRAVGRANGQNRIAIVIPCHRVVNKDGNLGGYGGGLRRKEFLLQLERG
jgi:AraC family transcriptional regulator of adaptative response/methylated-DNA-[protein]-cysteine methyltransferase